ncbi:MAG: hypothetical protein KAQ71_22095, partial [Desulfobulbaceae bacterium]|nr:hypothetical protein [Desulfobulbaceae bacterium]
MVHGDIVRYQFFLEKRQRGNGKLQAINRAERINLVFRVRKNRTYNSIVQGTSHREGVKGG